MEKRLLREMLLEQLSPIIETMLDILFERLEQSLQERQDANAPVDDEILTFKEVLERYKVSPSAFERIIRVKGLECGQALKKGNRRFLKSDCDKIFIGKLI